MFNFLKILPISLTMWYLFFSVWLTSLSMIISKYIHLTEAEDIKKRWQNHTELNKNDITTQISWWCDHLPRARHPGMWSQVGLRKHQMNKVSGRDGIPVELFQILKDDAVKVLHSIYQEISRTQQWPQDWKRTVFIPFPKKGNAKEC